MPSSLTRFHSRALAHLCPTTCVGFRYGRPWEHLQVFLDTVFEESASAEASTSSCETVTFNRRPFSYHMSSVSLTIAGAGILNLLSIDYASRPRLRSRLTLGGRTFPRKPWFYGGREFNPAYRYSCLHPHLLALHLAFPHGFNAPTMLSYHACPANRSCIQSFGIPLIANHFRRKIAR